MVEIFLVSIYNSTGEGAFPAKKAKVVASDMCGEIVAKHARDGDYEGAAAEAS